MRAPTYLHTYIRTFTPTPPPCLDHIDPYLSLFTHIRISKVTITGRSITFRLNETLLLGESVALSYWGTLDAQYYIAQSGIEQFLTTATDYTGVEHNAALLFSVSLAYTMHILVQMNGAYVCTYTLYICNTALEAVHEACV